MELCLQPDTTKSSDIEIYVSKANFEQAVGIGDISDYKKTRFAFDLVQEKLGDGVYKTAFLKVEDLFKVMYMDALKFELNHGFTKVNSLELFDELFDDLIVEVTS